MNPSAVLNDSDTGWHIRTGDYILSTGKVPMTDLYSHTMEGKPWFAWEWLAEVFMSLVHKVAGLNGVVFWANLTFAVTFTLLFAWMVKRGGNLLAALVLSRLAGFAAALHWLARPHLFTMILVLVWYIVLEEVQAQGRTSSIARKARWLLPLMIAVWSNLHGAFVIGEILLWIYCLGNFLTYLVSNDGQQRAEAGGLARFFGWVSVACLLATLLNPYGVRLHLHIIQSFLTSSGWLHAITEHGSPNFHMGVVRCFEALLLAGLVVFSVSWKRLSFIELGLLGFWTHMGLYSVRHIPLYVIVVVPILVRHCTIVLEAGETDRKVQSWVQKVAAAINRYSQNLVQIEKRFDTASYAKFAVLVMIGLCLNGGRVGSHRLLDFNFDESRFPIKASEFVERQDLKGNLFTSDLWAGYLIYRDPRRYKVFFDGRSDMYGESFVKEYSDLSALNFNWKDVLAKYRIAWMMVPANSSLATVLGESPEWESAYSDSIARVFTRRGETGSEKVGSFDHRSPMGTDASWQFPRSTGASHGFDCLWGTLRVQTLQTASRTIPTDILLWPARRSSKMMGNSSA